MAIGNSFSEDATRYLHDIARVDGKNLQVTNLYIGGCSLERHYRNMLSDEKAYELQYNGQKTGFSVSLRDAMLNRKWDSKKVPGARFCKRCRAIDNNETDISSPLRDWAMKNPTSATKNESSPMDCFFVFGTMCSASGT